MASIYGLYFWLFSDACPADFKNMAVAMEPYGSQRFGHTSLDLCFGGNLTRFLPEDDFDRQPLTSADGQSSLIADVRLDNRADLVASLGIPQPETRADSELLLAAWLRWGTACLDHIVGVFAFAIWTPSRQELFLARDHTGERPLFYHRAADSFAFASMPAGLLALPSVDQGVDEDTLIRALTLARYSQSVSFFKGIERLPPGHSLTVTPGKVAIHQFWKPFATPAPRYKKDSDYAEAFLELFDRAVAARLRANGPICSQLSSGFDSSSVTASAALQLAARGQRLTAFTAVPRPGFQGRGAHGRLPDEGPGAAEIAAIYPNLDHVLVDSTGQDMVQVITQLSNAAGEPVQNGINALWINAILDATRQRGANVLLGGMRGNLTFSHFGLEALGQFFRRGQWLRLARTARSFRQKGLISFRTSAQFALAGLLPDALFRRLARTPAFDLTYSAINPQIAEQHHLHQRMVGEFFANRHDLQADRLHLFQIYDFDTYAAAYQATHGIDVRDPYADRRVVDFCLGLPIEQFVAPGPTGPVPRSLARRSMATRLPQSTLTRTHRGQQGADWHLAIQDALPALRAQIDLNDQSPAATRLLDQPRMHQLLATWPTQSSDPSLDDLAARGDALCRAFSFGYFLRHALQINPTLFVIPEGGKLRSTLP